MNAPFLPCFQTPLWLAYPERLQAHRLWPADQDPLRVDVLCFYAGRVRFTTLNLFSN